MILSRFRTIWYIFSWIYRLSTWKKSVWICKKNQNLGYFMPGKFSPAFARLQTNEKLKFHIFLLIFKHWQPTRPDDSPPRGLRNLFIFAQFSISPLLFNVPIEVAWIRSTNVVNCQLYIILQSTLNTKKESIENRIISRAIENHSDLWNIVDVNCSLTDIRPNIPNPVEKKHEITSKNQIKSAPSKVTFAMGLPTNVPKVY